MTRTSDALVKKFEEMSNVPGRVVSEEEAKKRCPYGMCNGNGVIHVEGRNEPDMCRCLKDSRFKSEMMMLGLTPGMENYTVDNLAKYGIDEYMINEARILIEKFAPGVGRSKLVRNGTDERGLRYATSILLGLHFKGYVVRYVELEALHIAVLNMAKNEEEFYTTDECIQRYLDANERLDFVVLGSLSASMVSNKMAEILREVLRMLCRRRVVSIILSRTSSIGTLSDETMRLRKSEPGTEPLVSPDVVQYLERLQRGEYEAA